MVFGSQHAVSLYCFYCLFKLMQNLVMHQLNQLLILRKQVSEAL